MDNKTVSLEVVKGTRPEKPEDCPDNIFEIMQQCWKPDPDERPSFQALVPLFMQMKTDVPEESRQVENVQNYSRVNMYN